MKNKNIINIFSFLLLLTILMPCNVNAATVEFNVCFSNDEAGGAYKITYDDAIATEVTQSKVDLEAVKNRHVAYPEGFDPNANKEETKKYQFTANHYAHSCWVGSDNEVYTCPTNEQLKDYDLLKLVQTNSQGNYDYIDMNYRLTDSGAVVDITIDDIFDGKADIRYVTSGRTANPGSKKISDYDSSEFLTLSNGKYKITGVGMSETISLEVYIKGTGTCGGSLVGEAGFITGAISLVDYEIDNPAVPAESVYECSRVLDYYPEAMTSQQDKTDFDNVKRVYVPQCYDEKIYYPERANLRQTIDSNYKRLIDDWKTYSSDSTNTGVCSNRIKKQVFTYSSSYWTMTCTDTYTLNLKPSVGQIVKAGSGFEYQTIIDVERSCNVVPKGVPVTAKVQCTGSNCSHRCYWPGGEGNDAGPNDVFDNCIKDCDGGKYTQTCIDSCYSQVYGNDRFLSYSSKGYKYDFVNTSVTKISETVHSGSGGSCTTERGNPGSSGSYNCKDANGNSYVGGSYCVSNWCNGHGGYCVIDNDDTPAGCDWNACSDYGSKISSISSNLSEQNIKNAIKNLELGSSGTVYKYIVEDSYLTTAEGNKYKFITDNNSRNGGPKLNVTVSDGILSDVQTGSVTIGHNTNKTSNKCTNTGTKSVSYVSKAKSSWTITVKAPLSYVDKKTGVAGYKTNSTNNEIFTINAKDNKFVKFTNFKASDYYHDVSDDGVHERRYYTSTQSKDFNVQTLGKRVKFKETLDSNNNVKFEIDNLGPKDYDTNLTCYYGVYNEYYVESDPNCNPEKEICDGGIQYIYRPIDLTNIFPGDVNNGAGREPRWNWTGTVTDDESTGAALTAKESFYSGSQTVDPQKLIQDIESKGESIYDVSRDSSEIDYEFVLTRENIRNIRKYNDNVNDYNGDKSNNYLDYNMSCYNDGDNKQVCTSRFMDNIDGNTGSEASGDFITYTNHRTRDMRKSIAGCNNAINGSACDYFGS